MGWCWAVASCFLDHWLALIVGALILFKVWYKRTVGICHSSRRLDGLTALVTGANAGIGLETAKDLARRGARVLLACRNAERGQRALDVVRAAARGDSTVELLSLDLSSMESVRACAAKVLASEERLDILINNAGAGSGGLGSDETSDGLHRGLQGNYFGPFLFTLLLVDLLKKSAPSRIVFVSSATHEFYKMTPEQLEYSVAKDLGGARIYPMAALANILVSNELARRLRGKGVTVNSLHPGIVLTQILNPMPVWMRLPLKLFFRLFCKNAEEGAQTTIHLAVSEEVEGVTGRYFADCKEKRAGKAAYDEALARAPRVGEERAAGEAEGRRAALLRLTRPRLRSCSPSQLELSNLKNSEADATGTQWQKILPSSPERSPKTLIVTRGEKTVVDQLKRK